MIEVFSSGGGTQSNAICVLIRQGLLPKPDLIVIADTGREMPTTWQYLESVTRPKLLEIGVEIQRISQEYCSEAAKDYFHQSGSILIPVFSNQNGNASKLSAFCSNEWKQRVCNRWLKRAHGLERKDFRKWIGFSMDETNRVLRMMDGEEHKSGLIRFPLVHDFPTKRYEAIRMLKKLDGQNLHVHVVGCAQIKAIWNGQKSMMITLSCGNKRYSWMIISVPGTPTPFCTAR